MSQTISGPVRVRFAPSPTGFLHVGGARTAIYNDLLRQSVGGAFVLRIEDTDRERSDAAMTRQIQSALAWIGTAWDEGPFLQSERLARHRERGEELLAAGAAYRCFCTAELLAEQRAEAQKRGIAFSYPRTCLGLTAAEVSARVEAGERFAVRFRMPDDHIRFTDLVRGDMDFPPDALDDFILLRSDGSPTYHMSVVCDDIDMRITHVIRGEDHLSNTPKHIPLFEALGGQVPVFGHLPLILGTDKKRLSKRSGATSVEEFRAEGILPQALYNYLALLGWNPGGDREILSRGEMISLFSVDRLNASPAVFDREKLTWVNSQYLSSLPLAELLPHLQPFLAPQPVDLLFVDLTALVVAQRRPGAPEPMARVFGGIRAQPGPHLGIRISRGLPDRQTAVGGAGQPNGLARQPLRHPQRVLEHVHGATLGSRAQNFPLATSRSASFSSSASASSRLSREFCSRNSLSSLAASVSIPP